MRDGVVRLLLKSLLKTCQCVLCLPLILQGSAQIAECHGIIKLALLHLAIAADRFVDLALLSENVAKIIQH